MARPGPTIICEHLENDKTIQVCHADAVYAVMYQGRPVMLRKFSQDLQYQGYKYSKTSFTEPGHALRLARHLNSVQDTDDFSVGVMETKRFISLK